MSEEHDDIWFVQLRTGETRAWSLDELDEAFQANAIDEATLVRKDGQTNWAPLAVILAGTDATEQTCAVGPANWSEPPNSLSAQVIGQPMMPVPSAPPPPVVSEVFDLDPDSPPFKRSNKGLFVGLAAVAVIGVVAVTGVRIVGQRQALAAMEEASKVAAANALSAPPATAAPTADPPKPADPPTTRLTDDQKKKVLENDKKREAERAKRDAEAAKKAARGSHRSGKGSDPIRKGGSKYDPLNGAL